VTRVLRAPAQAEAQAEQIERIKINGYGSTVDGWTGLETGLAGGP
jgi:hypothetical protein